MSKKHVQLQNGKKVAYQEYGSGENVVLFYHGLIGSSTFDSHIAGLIENSKSRWIAFERPGYGESDPIDMAAAADWILMLEEILQHLNIDDFDVVGMSAGAVYAYATAYGFPKRTKEVFILNGVPAVYLDSVIKHYSSEEQQTYHSFKEQPMTEIQKYYQGYMQSAVQKLGDNEQLDDSWKDAMNHDCHGMARESKLQIVPWGIDLNKITCPILLWHAEGDEMVPISAVKEMQCQLPSSSLKIASDQMFEPNDFVHIKSCEVGLEKIIKSYI